MPSAASAQLYAAWHGHLSRIALLQLLSPRRSPSLSLRFGNRFSASGAHLSTFAFWRFRRGGGWSGAIGEHLAKRCNPSVYLLLLKPEAFDGGADDFVREFYRRFDSVFGSESLSVTTIVDP